MKQKKFPPKKLKGEEDKVLENDEEECVTCATG